MSYDCLPFRGSTQLLLVKASLNNELQSPDSTPQESFSHLPPRSPTAELQQMTTLLVLDKSKKNMEPALNPTFNQPGRLQTE